MNIVFFGSDEFSTVALSALYKSRHKIVSLVTRPDSKKGRGLKEVFPETKKAALKLGLSILQPENPNVSSFIGALKKLSADLFVVVSYGKILSLELINLPKRFSLNLHPSLLPKYRGAAPINWALLNGEVETGLSIIRLNQYMDAGDIITQKPIKIDIEDDALSLSKKLSEEGAKLLVDTIDHIEEGNVKFVAQDEKLATYAPMLKKSDGLINWGKTAQNIYNQIRALYDWPGAYTFLNGKLLKLFKAGIERASENTASACGTVMEVREDNILIKTGKDNMAIYELQMEGSKRLSTKEFLLGHSVRTGEVLGK